MLRDLQYKFAVTSGLSSTISQPLVDVHRWDFRILLTERERIGRIYKHTERFLVYTVYTVGAGYRHYTQKP